MEVNHQIIKLNDVYKEFNHTLKTLLRELMKRFDYIKEFKIMFTLYKVMKTFSKKSPQQYFNTLLAEKYSSEIMKKNYDFFLSDAFDDAETSYIIKPIKVEFAKISDEDREMIWRHMVLLLACNKNCLLEKKNR